MHESNPRKGLIRKRAVFERHSAKEPCISAKEPYISAKEPYPSDTPLKSPAYPQKSPIYPHKISNPRKEIRGSLADNVVHTTLLGFYLRRIVAMNTPCFFVHFAQRGFCSKESFVCGELFRWIPLVSLRILRKETYLHIFDVHISTHNNSKKQGVFIVTIRNNS